jgi:hypothetical protein
VERKTDTPLFIYTDQIGVATIKSVCARACAGGCVLGVWVCWLSLSPELLCLWAVCLAVWLLEVGGLFAGVGVCPPGDG